MTFDRRIEKISARVSLVSGSGDPARGRFCIMSFVALLAGEEHTDSPSTASQVIRNFAVPVNDAMPPQTRQRLKLFAPRIIGTNDGLETERAELLYRAFVQEILPRLQEDAEAVNQAVRKARIFERPWAARASRRLQATLAHMRVIFGEGGHTSNGRVPVDGAFGRTMILCARSVPSAERQAWYWNKAIELLDRLCDVGAVQRRASQPAISSQRVAALLATNFRETDDDAPQSKGLLAFHWLTSAAGTTDSNI